MKREKTLGGRNHKIYVTISERPVILFTERRRRGASTVTDPASGSGNLRAEEQATRD